MVVNIANALAAYKQTAGTRPSEGGAVLEAGAGSFSDTLKGMLDDTVKSLKESEKATLDASTGKANLQEVIMAVNNAEIMMQTITAIRDKVINAYQEVMRTSI